MRGLIGADALTHRVPGLSRCVGADIKETTLTEMERERIAACERVSVTVPGAVRGFDALHTNTTAGPRSVLIAADSSVAYRTLMWVTTHYDSPAVAAALDRDIALNGAPLVYRLDRAKCHQTDEVRELLVHHGVLMLHGPPRYPQFYGQLERQNREHRAWLNACGELGPGQLDEELTRMQYAWNCSLPRRSLAWETASDVWSRRPKLVVDRAKLKAEVDDRAARIQRQLDVRGDPADLAERLAIEAALMKHGWLMRRSGARC